LKYASLVAHALAKSAQFGNQISEHMETVPGNEPLEVAGRADLQFRRQIDRWQALTTRLRSYGLRTVPHLSPPLLLSDTLSLPLFPSSSKRRQVAG
jgi:hypothetical protein